MERLREGWWRLLSGCHGRTITYCNSSVYILCVQNTLAFDHEEVEQLLYVLHPARKRLSGNGPVLSWSHTRGNAVVEEHPPSNLKRRSNCGESDVYIGENSIAHLQGQCTTT